MKKFLMASLVAVMALAVFSVEAQNRSTRKGAGEMVTTVFTTDIDCPNCAKKVEGNLPLIVRGVEDIHAEVATREVTVVYDSSKTNEEKIIQGFARLKVKAEVKPAAEQE